MNYGIIYNLIYAQAALDGREAALFGDCASRADDVFERSFVGSSFPEVWFELPLLGEPWFDLHVLTSRESLMDGAASAAGRAPQCAGTSGAAEPAPQCAGTSGAAEPAPRRTGTAEAAESAPRRTGTAEAVEPAPQIFYPEVFEWFATQATDGRQLALSHDISKGLVDNPAVQLLLYHRNDDTMGGFFQAAGRPDAVGAYRAFMERKPQDWFACYAGVFPSRADMGLRVECIPTEEMQQAYAQDAALLEAHLNQLGISTAGTTIIPWCQSFARLPFRIEFQFNIAPDGTAEPTLGLSARFLLPGDNKPEAIFKTSGAAGQLMEQLEAWGLADDRWRLLPATAFSRCVSFQGESMRLYCFPTFVKIRWRNGEAHDAKAYLIASTW
ncbi:MAG: hypothetical protein IJ113_03235 [Eggerthellaceae bacterium]|nr:hypothetical protein [Eggerthellaceae bacterium]